MTKRHAQGLVTDQTEMEATLRTLIEQLESGEVSCVSVRVYHEDGWEDMVLGGDSEEERKQALEALHAMIGRAH